MTTKSTSMLPYLRQGDIDYASLDFNPDVSEHPVDSMEQNDQMDEIIGLLRSHFTAFGSRPDVFLSRETNICYDRNNLNVRISPDVYLVFGVDAQAIRSRRLYLPWEAGKPPDWVLEIASESTGRDDVIRKPAIYARIGVPEYWRFDATGGDYHGEPMTGSRLVGELYQPIELSTEPDGILKGYSEVLGLSLCWDEGWPRFYDPATGAYLENWRQEREARMEAEAEVRQLREELRRREG